MGLITPLSEMLWELFWYCHSVESGWSGPVYRRLCWPREGGLMNQFIYVVQGFQVIESELMKIAAEKTPVEK